MSYPAKVLTTLALVAAALLLWRLRDLVLLVFAGVLAATALDMLVGAVGRWCRLGRRPALLASVAMLLLVGGLLGWWIGSAVAGQLGELRQQLPRAVAALRDWLSQSALGDQLLGLWNDATSEGVGWQRVAGAAELTLTVLGNALVVALLAIFLAAEPRLYRDGAVRLLPPPQREPGRQALDACGDALRGWLKGQALSMLFVGVATWLGLWALGVPLALSLGLLAGLLDFVPFIGPIVSGLLAVLIAFAQGPSTALWVAGLGLAIQQVEGNLIIPLVQRWTVALPPALGIVAVFIAAGVLGLPGILLATPLMVVGMVLAQRLYIGRLLEGGAD